MSQAVAGVIAVDLLQATESEAWDNFVASHPQGNIYHTLAWRAVTQEGLGHRPFYLRASDSSGNFTGCLPLFLVGGIFGRRLVSVPMRDRGGVLANDSQTASRLVRSAIELSRELRCRYIELRSLDEMDELAVSENQLRCDRHWTTTRVDLAPGVQELWKNLDRNAVRWAINKSKRSGITFDDDESLDGIYRFYDMFVATRSGMGIPPFPKSLFVAVWGNLIQAGLAKLFFVWSDSQPIHGMINFLSKDTFIPAYAAPQGRWRKSYPNEVMFWSTMEWASERGFKYYDFGADSPRQDGLLWFKRKWGGVQHKMFYYYSLNGSSEPPSFDSSATRFAAFRQAWAKLPLGLSQSLGGWVTRQLS